MKKLKFNSTLNHKVNSYKTYEISVEKVITLYGNSFNRLKNDALNDNPYIAENRDLMYIDSDDVAHCLLFVDYDTGDGILVESEGSEYARKSQFIPNARALLESNELTAAETRLHSSLRKIADKIAELAHCGETSFTFDKLLEESDLDVKSVLRDAVTAMLREREDIQMAESQSIEVPFQPDITVEVKPTQELTFYCPLRIVREYDASDYEFDEEVIDDMEEIPSRFAVDCEREINDFIQDYSEPEEENRGLMVYFDNNPAVSEKVFSAIPSVKEINGELIGVFKCQVVEDLTGNELEDLRSHLIGQCSDGFFEGMEQHEIKTADFGEIYVSFWNDSNDWSLQTEEEFFGQEISQEPEMNMSI
ncbi:DUF6329 domain-containing protein [Ruminococcus sp.]|uniref:DUF6329 domain-containing protein n=1 Tax=Ruminococcus sp. TaxID=41978 RepID=UPI002E7A19D6|nr:DUF6329 domain-containing protein [Ruminococcus sp.]MEE0023305.1 DUF6329 domain-containing protein [Ruminococcus sp.]